MTRAFALTLVITACAGCSTPESVSPRLELGTGSARFEPLADGDTLPVFAGCQGGRHVFVSLRAAGLDSEAWAVTVVVEDEAGPLSLPFSAERIVRARELVGVQVLIDPRRLDPRRVRPVSLFVQVRAGARDVSVQLAVRLVAGPSCFDGVDAGVLAPPDAGLPGSADSGVVVDAATPRSPLAFEDSSERIGLAAAADTVAVAPQCLFDDPFTDAPGDYCVPEQLIGGVAAGDADGDGDTDVYFTHLDTDGTYYRNDDGHLVDRTAEAGLVGTRHGAGAAFEDIDGDGDLDLYVTRIAERSHLLFVNQGAGRFTEEGESRGLSLHADAPFLGTTAAFADVDRDGDSDVFVGEWRLLGVMPEVPLRARFLRNDGRGRFVDETSAAGLDTSELWRETGSFAGVFSFMPAFVDLDADGRLDLALTGDYGTTAVFFQEADGRFVRGPLSANRSGLFFGMGAAFADLDSDGLPEWFATGLPEFGPANRLFRQLEPRYFREVAATAGVVEGGWGWGAAAIDVDLDGDVDLVQTAGGADPRYRGDPMRLFLQTGPLVFRDAARESGLLDVQFGRGLAPVDLDRDGDVDLLVARSGASAVYLESHAAEHAHWLRVEVVGAASGVRAHGARVWIVRREGDAPSLRIIGVESGYLGGTESAIDVGLGQDASPVFEVRVVWPRSGLSTTVRGVQADSVLVVRE